MHDQTVVDRDNAAFWTELCGSSAARAWGITDRSKASLRRYDENFFGYYPYLDRHIPWRELRGKRALDVGLGYCSIAQRVIENGALYTGLDIAPGPIVMLQHRLRESGLTGNAVQGSILSAPLPAESFDVILAIGSLHHTGDMRRAIACCHRLLAPGGRLIGMVYYAYSHRRLWNDTKATAQYFRRELLGFRGTIGEGNTFAYDHNADHSLAPATEFISIRSLRALCSGFSDFRARTENSNQEPPFTRWPREQLLASPLPRLCGLDLYWSCRKDYGRDHANKAGL